MKLLHILGLYKLSDFNGVYLVISSFCVGYVIYGVLNFLWRALERYQSKKEFNRMRNEILTGHHQNVWLNIARREVPLIGEWKPSKGNELKITKHPKTDNYSN